MQFTLLSRTFKHISFSFFAAALVASPSYAVFSVPGDALPFKISLPSHPDPATTITPGRVLVGLKPDVDAETFVKEIGLPLVDRIPEIGVEVLETPEGQEETYVHLLAARSEVEYAEADRLYHTCSVPNDPYFSKYQWYANQIRLPQAWEVTTGSSDVTIAVLDTGVDTGHPDLASKLVPGYNAFTRSSNIEDDEGHGTHVSGLAGAIGGNGKGIAGVSWGARIMPVKVLDADGSGPTSTIAQGINWAANHGAKILNMSLGAPGYSRTLANAVAYARGKGCLIVVAAGNEYEDGNPVEYPAAYSGVMAVGASNNNDERSSYSNVGDYVSVVAPGGDPTSARDQNNTHWILSTWPTDLSDGIGYEAVAGTSQATPIVSGVAALIWSLKPEFTADQVRDVIEKTAVDVGAPGWDAETGYGRVNAEAAVAAVAPATPAPSTGTGDTGGLTGGVITLAAGDLNGDGKVNVADATVALRIAAGLVQPSVSQLRAGDVAPVGQPDGKINVSDATRLLRVVAGLDQL